MEVLIGVAIGAFMGIVGTLLFIVVSYDRYKEKKK